MDRFKFRVWNNLINKYTYFDSPVLNCGESIEDSGLLFKAVGKIFLEGYNDDIEQCTGLKDKNGNLIYENDIVKDINGHYGYIKWDSQELKYFVYKKLGLVPYLTSCSMVHSYEYEIVGNIHENKDLLGGM